MAVAEEMMLELYVVCTDWMDRFGSRLWPLECRFTWGDNQRFGRRTGVAGNRLFLAMPRAVAARRLGYSCGCALAPFGGAAWRGRS